MSRESKYKTLKEQVRIVLTECPESRNYDDQKVAWLVWQRFYGVNDSVTQGQYLDLPPEHEVSRMRRKWQEMYLYAPTDWKVAKARRWNEVEWKKALGYMKDDSAGQMNLL